MLKKKRDIEDILRNIGESQERIGQSQEELLQSQKKTERLIQETAMKAEKDRERAEKDRVKAEKDREKIEKDRKKAEKDREKAREKTREKNREEDRQFFRKLREVQEDTWRQIRETDRQMQKTDSRFQSQWGRLMETLVDGELVRHLNQRNIEVTGTTGRSKRFWNGKEYEFDSIAINGDEVVVVEVKTILGPEEVKHFLGKLKDFKHVAHEYKNKIIYGLVAYLQVDAKADQYAEKQGLFVVRATGNSSSLLNSENFIPKKF